MPYMLYVVLTTSHALHDMYYKTNKKDTKK